MKTLVLKLLKHFSYPSSWQGLVGIAAAVGLTIAPELQAHIVTGGVALAGAFAFFFSDADVEN